MTDGIDNAHYRVSSYSGGGSCVEVRRLESGDVVIRDSNDRSVSIVVTYADWVAFIAGVKKDEFDFSPK